VKALKLSLVVLGAISLGIGLFMVVNLAMHMPSIVRAANEGRTGDAVFASPMTTIWILSGVSLLCGLLIGLGIGFPRQTNSRVRKATLEEAAAQRERSIRENALKQAGSVAPRAGIDAVEDLPATIPAAVDAGDEKTVEIPAEERTETRAIGAGDAGTEATTSTPVDPVPGTDTEENGR
jgi:F420-0:gamma-glutamyl ligase-like protein